MARYKCPICWKPLIRREVAKKGEYFHCDQHGSFLHLGFFHKIDNAAGVGKRIFESRTRIVENKKNIEIKCSYCLRKMTETLYSEESGLLLDQCFKCNHVWFDKNELAKVVVPSSGEFKSMMSHAGYQRSYEFQEEEPYYSNPFSFLELPVEDTKDTAQHLSVFTYVTALLCAAVTWKGLRDFDFLTSYAFNPAEPFAHYGLTFITSILLHGDWWHFFGNIYFLYMLADNIEDHKGFLFTLQLFLISGIGANAVYMLAHYNSPTIGASGAVAGLLSYYCFRYPHIKIHQSLHIGWGRRFQYSVSASMYLIIFLMTQLLGIFRGHTAVNYIAHVAGAFFGFLIFFLESSSDETKKKKS